MTVAEYRALVAPRLPPRIAKLAATLALTSAAWTRTTHAEVESEATAKPPRPVAPEDVVARSRAVFAALGETVGERATWRSSSRLARIPPDDAAARPSFRYEMHVPIRYGNSHSGVFDTELARDFARRLFGAYGLTPEAGFVSSQRVSDDRVAAVIDGVVPAAGIGFELHDAASYTTLNRKAKGTRASPPEDVLDDAERDTLRARGVDLHVAAPYRRNDGDLHTPTSTYLLGVLEYLNAMTDGPDVPIEYFVDRVGWRIPIGMPRFVSEATLATSQSDRIEACSESIEGFRIEVGRKRRVALDLDAAAIAAATPRYRLRAKPRESLDDPPEAATVDITLGTGGCGSPLADIEVVVPAVDGGGERRVRETAAQSDGYVFPNEFDLRLPFRIEFDATRWVVIRNRLDFEAPSP